MTIEVGGGGTLGVAFETTLGTYVAPSKWIPIRSESLEAMEDVIYRMNIRGLAERSGVVPGYTHVEGDIVFEVTPDTLPYFLYASRYLPAKSGVGPFTYDFSPVAVAKTTTAALATTRKTLSILVERGGNPMAYLGCAVGQMVFTVDNGMMICTASIVGVDEAAQTGGTPTWDASSPIGPGDITLEVPTATARGDADTFSLTINDNLVNANRLNGQRKAAYQNWGEREITLDFEVDFDALTDYNAFRNKTVQEVTLTGVVSAAVEEFNIVIGAYAIDSISTPLAGLGDVNRASISGHGFHDSADSLALQVITAEDLP